MSDEITITSVLAYSRSAPSVDIEAVIESLARNYEAERESLLQRLAVVERELGYGAKDKPTTAQIRKWWRGRIQKCPHCDGTL